MDLPGDRRGLSGFRRAHANQLLRMLESFALCCVFVLTLFAVQAQNDTGRSVRLYIFVASRLAIYMQPAWYALMLDRS